MPCTNERKTPILEHWDQMPVPRCMLLWKEDCGPGSIRVKGLVTWRESAFLEMVEGVRY